MSIQNCDFFELFIHLFFVGSKHEPLSKPPLFQALPGFCELRFCIIVFLYTVCIYAIMHNVYE